MDWSDLPFFLAVARTGQLARAARTMATDATTVGRRIRRLERAVGERLFEQGSDGQVLTIAGAALLARAEAMAQIAGGIAGGIGQGAGEQASAAGIRAAIRVSVAEGFGTWFVSRHLAALADRHPGLEVDLVANSGFLDPTRRETDLAVLLARPRRGPLVTRKLADYRLGLYAVPALAGAIDAPAALPLHRFVGYVPDIVYAPELRYLEELPVSVAPQLRSSSINAQAAMIAAGAGVGILPCFIGDGDPRLVRVLPHIAIARSFWLVTHRETRDFPQVRLFGDWLVALASANRALLLGAGSQR